MYPPYDREYATIGLDRAHRIPLRLLYQTRGEASTSAEHTNLCDEHVFPPPPPLAIMAAPPTAEEWAALQRELADLKAAQEPKPLSASFNPPITTIPSCLVVPNIPPGVPFSMPHGLIANLPKFCGLPHENALSHVKAVVELCVTQNEHNVGKDAYRMRVFPLTLIDRAKGWLNQLPPETIHSWEALQTKFFEKYFPINKRLAIEAQINAFQQQ